MTLRLMTRHGTLPVGPTDGDEVRAFQSGDRTAFDRLVDRHQKSLLRLSLRLLGASEDARDLFQDVFLQVFRNLKDLEHPDAFRSWMYQIAIRMARKRRMRPRPVPAAETLELLQAPTAMDAIERREDLDRLRTCLERLPGRQKEVVLLRNYEDLSFAEIGRILGISEEAARANHYQGLRRLRGEFHMEESP